MRFLARGFNEEGNAASRVGNTAEAERLWRQAVTVDPEFSAAWFNLGLLHKHRAEWKECLECNRQAVKVDPRNVGAWWNFGIAATALRRWPEARRAWAAQRIPLPAGEGEPRVDFGMVPIRFRSRNASGVVAWGDMIDPARVRLLEVPRTDYGFRFGDIVLRDPAPDGEREVDGRKLPIFNVLGLWEGFGFGTFDVTFTAASERVTIMEADLQTRGWGWEEWSAVPEPTQTGELRWAIAAPSESALKEWLAAQEGVSVRSVECVVKPL
jgi:hypothetical protein